jgi:hypothetical protein
LGTGRERNRPTAAATAREVSGAFAPPDVVKGFSGDGGLSDEADDTRSQVWTVKNRT